ncbi:MAG: peptide transporter [Sphingomonas sp.]|nr:peptide transporter [Sphingomonas sp.]
MITCITLPAAAQTASQLAPESFAPRQEREGGPVVLPRDTGVEPPPGADKIDLRIREVVVEGANADDPQVQALRARLAGKTISVAEVYAAAAALESAYARQGKVLTRVIVPAQTLEGEDAGAVVRLRVVSGYIERVDVSSLDPHVRARAAAIAQSLANNPDIRLADIERRLMLISDVPGLRLRSALAAGSELGASVLVLTGEYAPINGFVAYDNSLADALGRDAASLGLNFNSVFGAGEQIYLRVSGLPNTGNEGVLEDHPRNRSLAAGITVPLSNNGLMLTGEFTDARTTPRRITGFPGTGSQFNRVAATLSYPFVRTRALSLSADLAFEATKERVDIVYPIDLPLSEDRLRIFRLEGRATWFPSSGGYVDGSVRLSQGVDAFGARSAADATPLLPLSRAGADSDFTTVNARVEVQGALAGPLRAAMMASGQTSFGSPVVNGEQFGVARVDAISALPSGTVQGDSGYAVRGEFRLSLPLPDTVPVSLVPYVYGARAGLRLYAPTFFEQRDTAINAWGVGVRATLLPGGNHPYLTGRVEYGRADVSGRGDDDRLTFSVMLSF